MAAEDKRVHVLNRDIQLHRDERLATGYGDLVDGANVRIAERGGGLGFSQEALLGLFVVEQMGGEELQCDGPFERGVLGLVDYAHAALSERLDDLVVADGPTDHDMGIIALRASRKGRPKRADNARFLAGSTLTGPHSEECGWRRGGALFFCFVPGLAPPG